MKMDDKEAWFAAARTGDVSALASYALSCAGLASAGGTTALMIAAEKNYADACTILMDLEGGMLDNEGHTALYYSIRAGACDACKVLLQCENEHCTESSTRLYTAAIKTQSPEILRAILGVIPIGQEPGGTPILAMAVSRNSIELVRVLLDSGTVRIGDICQALCYVKESSEEILSILRDCLQQYHRDADDPERRVQCFVELEEEIFVLTKQLINAGIVRQSDRESFSYVSTPTVSADAAFLVMKKDAPFPSQSSYVATLRKIMTEIVAKYASLKGTLDQAMQHDSRGLAQYESLMVDLWRVIDMQENHLSSAQSSAPHVCESCRVYEADFHKLRCENLQILHELVKVKKDLYKKEKEVLDLANKKAAPESTVDGELNKIVIRVFDDIADFREKLAHLKAVSLAKDEIIEEMRVELDKARIGHLLYPNSITSVEKEREERRLSLESNASDALERGATTSPTQQSTSKNRLEPGLKYYSPLRGSSASSNFERLKDGCFMERSIQITSMTQNNEANNNLDLENHNLKAKIREQEGIISTLNAEINTMLETFNATKHFSMEKARKATTDADAFFRELIQLAKLFELDESERDALVIGPRLAEKVIHLQSQLKEEKINRKRYKELLEQQESDMQYLLKKLSTTGQRDTDLTSILAKYELLSEKIETTNQLVESLSREESPVICRATSPLRISRSLTPATNLTPASPGNAGGEEFYSSPRGGRAITAELEIEKLRESISELTNVIVKKDEKIKSLLESISLLQGELVADDFVDKRASTISPTGLIASLTKSRIEAINSSKAEYQAVIRTLTEDRDNLREQLRLTASENKELQIMNFSLQNSLSRTKSILEKSSILAESLASSNSPKRTVPRIKHSPLHEATICNDIEKVKDLISHAGEVDERGNTSLMAASRLGYYEIASILVSHESRYKNQFGDTALMFAAVSGHSMIVELLAPYEATAQNETGLTALMLAAEAGHISCVQLLIGFEVRLVNRQYETALVLAAGNDRPECVRVLVEYESGHRCISLDEQSGTGETALMRACKVGAKECVEILVGWEHDIRDVFGNTAAHYASDPDILSYFS